MDLNRILEASRIDIGQHMDDEHKLFKRLHEELNAVTKMAKERLSGEPKPNGLQKEQYQEMLELNAKLQALMKQHLDSYD